MLLEMLPLCFGTGEKEFGALIHSICKATLFCYVIIIIMCCFHASNY